jgi:hypothetical protein
MVGAPLTIRPGSRTSDRHRPRRQPHDHPDCLVRRPLRFPGRLRRGEAVALLRRAFEPASTTGAPPTSRRSAGSSPEETRPRPTRRAAPRSGRCSPANRVTSPGPGCHRSRNVRRRQGTYPLLRQRSDPPRRRLRKVIQTLEPEEFSRPWRLGQVVEAVMPGRREDRLQCDAGAAAVAGQDARVVDEAERAEESNPCSTSLTCCGWTTALEMSE